MPATKTGAALIASQSNAAGAGQVTAASNQTTAYGCTITARVTNGGTGPTIAASVSIYISTDNATWRLFATVTAGTTASEVDDFVFQIPPTVLYVQCSMGGNTGQAVTIEAYIHSLTTI